MSGGESEQDPLAFQTGKGFKVPSRHVLKKLGTVQAEIAGPSGCAV